MGNELNAERTVDVTRPQESFVAVGQAASAGSGEHLRIESSLTVVQRHVDLEIGGLDPFQGQVGVSCPGCNTNFEYLSVVDVAWEPSERSYYLRARLCGPCAFERGAGITVLGKVALAVATTSRCSCGRPLALAEH